MFFDSEIQVRREALVVCCNIGVVMFVTMLFALVAVSHEVDPLQYERGNRCGETGLRE